MERRQAMGPRKGTPGVAFPPERGIPLDSKHVGKHERSHYRCIRLDYELGSVHFELAPRDFLVGHRARIRTVARCRVGNLAEVRPAVYLLLHVLRYERDHADGEIP